MSPDDRTDVSDRFRAIREATGLSQHDFAAKLDAAARALEGDRIGRRRYLPPTVSKLETGAQKADLDDIAAYAAVDPLHRGKLWVAWNETVDATLGASLDVRPYYGEDADVVIARRQAEQERAAETVPGGAKKGQRRA